MENSSIGRLIGVLFSPGKTFQSIAAKPTWGLALVVLMLVTGLVFYLAGTRTDYRDVISQSASQSGREIPADALDTQIEMMEKVGPVIQGLTTPIAFALMSLFGALIYWILFKLMGSDFSYKSSLSVSLHAMMPLVVSLLLSIPVILSRSMLKFEDMKSGTFLQSNLSFLAPEDAPAWLTALYASVDFFTLWGLVLSIIGYRAVSRLSTKAVAVAVIIVTLLFIGVRVGLAALS